MASEGTVLTEEIRREIEALFPCYPTRRAVVLPALHIVHRHLRHVPSQAVQELAQLLELHPAEVQDTLSFYGFFHQEKPHGKYRLWVCRSLSCSCRGGEELLAYLSEKLGIRPGETTPDGLFTLEVAECLGICDVAPAMLVNEQVYGELTKEKIDELLTTLARQE